jgi:hypothetical protein
VREFLLGIVSSLAASALIIAGAALGSHKPRHWLVLGLSRLTGTGIVRTYRTQKDANQDLPEDLARARWIRVLAGRGNELTRDSFQPVWKDAGGRLERVEILLPDPVLGSDSWVAKREAENARHDKGYEGGLLADQVRANIDYILNVAQHNSNVSLRLYDLPNLYRVVATDQVVYMTIYSASSHGRNSPCLVFRNPSPMYDLGLRIFTTAWSVAHSTISDEERHGR